MDQLDLPLLFTFLEQKVGVSNNLIRLLNDLVNIRCLAKKFGIVLLVVLHSLLLEELFAHVSPRVQLLGSQLHIDEVGFFQNFVHFVHFLALQLVDVASQIVKEVVDGRPDVVSQVELLTVGDLRPVLHHLVQLLVHVLDEVLGSRFQQQNLIVVITVMTEVAALLADQFIVDDAESHVRLQVVWAHLVLRIGSRLFGAH